VNSGLARGRRPHRLSGRPARRTGFRVASRLPFLPRTVALASRRTHPPEVTRASRGSGSSGSAAFGSALPGSRFRRLPGVPTRSAGSRLSPRPRLSWPRAPLQGSPESRRRSNLSGFALLGFTPLQRFRNRGFGHRGLCLPATFRPRRFSRPRRFAPRKTSPGLFHPGNAPGVSSSGPCSSPGAVLLSKPLLSRRWNTAARCDGDLDLRALLSPESSYRPGPKARTAAALLTFPL